MTVKVSYSLIHVMLAFRESGFVIRLYVRDQDLKSVDVGTVALQGVLKPMY